METLQALASRKSVRKFTEEKVTAEEIKKLLTAGMSGPSCVNKRMWSFVVVQDKEMLVRMAEANGPYSMPLKNAPLGILVCGDLERALPEAPNYWTVDAAIATQNIVLAAHDMGLGAVWLGCWPVEERVAAIHELFSLPESAVPHSLIAIGHPVKADLTERDLYEADRVHFEKW